MPTLTRKMKYKFSLMPKLIKATIAGDTVESQKSVSSVMDTWYGDDEEYK